VQCETGLMRGTHAVLDTRQRPLDEPLEIRLIGRARALASTDRTTSQFFSHALCDIGLPQDEVSVYLRVSRHEHALRRGGLPCLARLRPFGERRSAHVRPNVLGFVLDEGIALSTEVCRQREAHRTRSRKMSRFRQNVAFPPPAPAVENFLTRAIRWTQTSQLFEAVFLIVRDRASHRHSKQKTS
jgi:hypothetical protein